jgi:hypothetical protein
MIPQKIQTTIASCTTLLQLDTCQAWADYIFLGEALIECSVMIQRKRNEINLKQGNLEDIYDMSGAD